MKNEEVNLQLTCEYLKTPIGIQNKKPRFGWNIEETDKKTIQKAYQIQVYNLSNNCIWDSGIVESRKCSAVEYDGNPLESFQIYCWNLTIWLTELNHEDITIVRQAKDTFEMGILSQDEWRGKWICAKEIPTGVVPLIRRSFWVKEIPERARVYLSGIGYCEAWINGKKLDDAYLDPGWTDYNKTVLYRVYDISNFLQQGENVFSAELGGGWLTLDHIAFKKMIGRQVPWLSEPKILCNIYLNDQCITTMDDGTWTYTEGPVQSHNLYDGEYYDASREKTGYRLPFYQEREDEWKKAVAAKSPSGIMRSQIMPPIRKVKIHEPKYIEYIGEDDNYDMTVDFGVNFSGWIKIKAKGKSGQKISIRYGETLCQDHTVNQKNLRGAKGKDVFVFGKQENITYQPHFSYHGFRYAQIEMDSGVIVEEIIGCEIHTDVQKIGKFLCSNKVLNRIQEVTQRTEENNLHSVPTDCPQRDERLGWMNDMTVRFEEGLYNFDMILFYEKWLQDIADSQRTDGALPDTVPYFFGEQPASHISSVYLLLPWNLYLFYNDTQILKRHYANMKKYLDFKLNERQENGMLPEKYFGDWAPPMTEAVLGWGENAVPKNLTQSFITTCYLYYDCKIMKDVSEILGCTADTQTYRENMNEIAKNLNSLFFNDKEGCYDKGSQGCNTFPLFLGIVAEENRARVKENLVNDIIQKHQYHITTGNQMTKYLYEVLNQEKLNEVAFRIASSETYPSIGFMLKNGATTIWERWEHLTNKHMNSHNHPMLGAFTVWFYKGLAGICLSECNERRLLLRPAIIKSLEYVEAEHRFPWGLCNVRWEKFERNIVYKFDIPWSMTATIDFSNCEISYSEIICDGKQITHADLKEHVFETGSYQIILQIGNESE